MEPVLIGIRDTAKMLGIGRSKAYGLIGEGILETITIGSRRLVKLESIHRLVEVSAAEKAA